MVWAIRFKSVSNSEDWSFHDQIAVWPEQTHEVTRCKRAQRERAWRVSALSPSVNMRATTSAAVIYITHKSHEPIKNCFGGTKICSRGRQKNFNAGKTRPVVSCCFFVQWNAKVDFFKWIITQLLLYNIISPLVCMSSSKKDKKDHKCTIKVLHMTYGLYSNYSETIWMKSRKMC